MEQQKLSTRCPECSSPVLRDTQEEVSRSIGDLVFRTRVPARKCDACGEVYLDGPALARFDLLVAAKLAELGVSSGPAFKFMRKAAGLRAADLASLIEVDVATISRWETGKVPIDRAALAIVGALVRDQLAGTSATLDHLRSLKASSPPPEHLILL